MPVDVAEKRKASSGISLPLIPGVTPTSEKGGQWRREAAWNYPIMTVAGGAWAAGQAYLPGAQAGQAYLPGAQQGEVVC